MELNQIFKESELSKSNIFCPICGKKKVFWVDNENGDYTHYCKNCKNVYICKGSRNIN